MRLLLSWCDSQKDLAQQLGTSADLVSHILHGRRAISAGLALRASDAFHVSVRWMLTGEGDPFEGTVSTTTGAPEPEVEVVMRPCCGDCGARVTEGAGRCLHCGAHLRWPERGK